MDILDIERKSGSQNVSFNVTATMLITIESDEAINLPESRLELEARQLAKLITYIIIYITGTLLNVIVLIGSYYSHRSPENRYSRNSVHLMVAHLAISDLIVCAVICPLEIGWRITVAWVAGNVACKILMYLRAFAYYLSSLTLVALSLDRYWAVSQPLASFKSANRHYCGKPILPTAWALALLLAIPQTFALRVVQSPRIPSFSQCTTSAGYFMVVSPLSINSEYLEIILGCMFLFIVYFLPLIVIITTYVSIYWRIQQKKKENGCILMESILQIPSVSTSVVLRRHSTLKQKSNKRGLLMPIVQAMAFICSWTPFVVVELWLIFDSTSIWADEAASAQDILSIFPIVNSCVNPLVHGSNYFKSLHRKLFKKGTSVAALRPGKRIHPPVQINLSE